MGRHLGGLACEVNVEAALALVLHERARRAAAPVGAAHDAAARPEDDHAAAAEMRAIYGSDVGQIWARYRRVPPRKAVRCGVLTLTLTLTP